MEQALVNQVWQRAGSICEYCRMPQQYDLLSFQIDHIIARKHHGSDELGNLALACFACNNHKGPNVAGVDPETGEVVRLFHPRQDHWADHFDKCATPLTIHSRKKRGNGETENNLEHPTPNSGPFSTPNSELSWTLDSSPFSRAHPGRASRDGGTRCTRW